MDCIGPMAGKMLRRAEMLRKSMYFTQERVGSQWPHVFHRSLSGRHFWPFSPSWVFQNHFVSVLCCHCKRYHKLTGLENTRLSPYNFCRLGIWSGPYCCWHPCSFLKALKDRSFSLPFPVSKKPTFLGLRSPFLSSEPAMASWDPFTSCNSNNLFCLPLSLWLYGTYPGNPG